MESTGTPPAGRKRFWPAFLWRAALLVAFLAGVHYGGRWLIGALEAQFMPWYQVYGGWALAVLLALYVVLMALPFVPGIEVSLAILMILGVDGVGAVYGSTLAALCLSFAVGRLLPVTVIGRLFGWLHLHRARAFVERLAPLGPEARLALLVAAAPVRLIPFLLRHRYLAVAVAFNVPGNALIGGGGGIGLAAGLSGLFRFPAYVAMVAVAISPIPVAMLLNHWWW